MPQPIIQSKDRFATNNLRLEGNRQRPLQDYVELWESILVPRGGLEGLIMEGCCVSSAVAFSLSIGGLLVPVLLVIVITMIVGGLAAVTLEPRLYGLYWVKLVMLGLGFILSFL